MNKKIIIFNIIYYAVIIALFGLGRKDPSSSLGYGFIIIIIWVLAAVILGLLLFRKIIRPTSTLDKIGVFTATPILTIVFIMLSSSFREDVSSEWHFSKNNYRYKVITVEHDRTFGGRRFEYYRSADTLNPKDTSLETVWVKDSTWIYLSKTGDTVKKVKYSNSVEVK